jgi:hypothetical protein
MEKYPLLTNNEIKLTRLFDVIWPHFSPDGNLERLQFLLNLTEKGFKRGLRLNTRIPHFSNIAGKDGNVWQNIVVQAVFWVTDFSMEEKRKFSQLMKILIDCGANNPEIELELEGVRITHSTPMGVWAVIPDDSKPGIIDFAEKVGSLVLLRKLITFLELEENDTIILEQAINNSTHT